MAAPESKLQNAYGLEGAEDAARFYDTWAGTYDAEVAENGYVTPKRCAEALAAFVGDKSAPIMDLGCGSGLSGIALRAAGFETIDGFDISEGMLEQARGKGCYRAALVADLSQPLEIAEGAYAHAAAIGAVNPGHLPVSVIDEILSKLPAGGCFVFSVNDHAAADGTVVGRINEIVDTCTADLVFKDYGDHLPGIELFATVYVLKKR